MGQSERRGAGRITGPTTRRKPMRRGGALVPAILALLALVGLAGFAIAQSGGVGSLSLNAPVAFPVDI